MKRDDTLDSILVLSGLFSYTYTCIAFSMQTADSLLFSYRLTVYFISIILSILIYYLFYRILKGLLFKEYLKYVIMGDILSITTSELFILAILFFGR